MSLLPGSVGHGKAPSLQVNGNDVVGDLVCGNKTYNSVVVKYSSFDISAIVDILKQIEHEVASGQKSNSLIGKFDHYYNYEHDKPLRSIEDKLTAGNRGADDELRKAKEDKEYFRRALDKFMFFRSAQKLFAHFLDFIYHEYHDKAYPLIKAGAPKEQVDAVIATSIVAPVAHSLITSEDFLGVSTAKGMLMFLTQKCIVDWD